MSKKKTAPYLQIAADQFDAPCVGDRIHVTVGAVPMQATITLHRPPEGRKREGFMRITIGGLSVGIYYVKGWAYQSCL